MDHTTGQEQSHASISDAGNASEFPENAASSGNAAPPDAAASAFALEPRRRSGFARWFSGWISGSACWFALSAGLLLVASMAAVPAIAPYHVRVRGTYLTLVPLTAGFLIGASCPMRGRLRVRAVLAIAAVELLLALAPSLRHDLPRSVIFPALAAGLCISVGLVRLGMWQAGVAWGDRGDVPPFPRWVVTLIYAVAWSWLLLAVLNPRETFPPTRWLLTATGRRVSESALGPSRVSFKQYRISERRPDPERGAVATGDFVFTVGPLAARPNEIVVSVSARRRDGAPFGRPVWLTIDADDPLRPDPMNDLEHFDAASVPGGTPEAQAMRRSGSASRITQFAWFSVIQSLPAVTLRARIWTLDRELDTGDLLFTPVAEAELGTWDLTPLSRLRHQPVRNP